MSAEGNDAVWHLTRDGRAYGPYPFPVLIEGARRGVFAASDLVWRPGWESWRRADSLSELFAPPATTAPAAAPSSNTDTAADSPPTDAGEEGDRRAPERATARRNYFVRHWQGQLSLPVSYWVNGCLTSAATLALVQTLNWSIEHDRISIGAPIVAALLCTAMMTLTLSTWQMVGVWRSATRHAAGGKRLWANAAKLLIIVGVVRVLADFVTVFVPVVTEHVHIAMGDERMGKNHFRLLREGTELEFSGPISFGTAKEFARLLDAASQVRVLHLNSNGGRIVEADRMAAEVRKRALITYVSDHCHSACTHVFLAGRERWIHQNGVLGFHQPGFAGLAPAELTKTIEEERKYLTAVGLPDPFVSKALKTPNDSMWTPTRKELVEAGVISGVADNSRFAMSGRGSVQSKSDIESALLKLPLYAALQRTEPAVFNEILEEFSSGYSRGMPEGDMVSRARAVLSGLLHRRLPYATDADILQSADIRIAYMEALGSTDPESCVAIDDGTKGARLKSDLTKQFPDISRKEIAFYQNLIESRPASRGIPTDEEIEPYLEKARVNLEKQGTVDFDVVGKAKLIESEFAPYCQAALTLYRELRRLPADESAAVFRNFFADASK